MNKEPENLLLAIEVENAFSVRDTVRIDFRATNIKTNQAKMLSDNIFVWNKQKILKTIGLFGPNAAGKSNIIKASRFFCQLVLDCLAHNEGTTFNFRPFKFEGYDQKPTRFFINFVCKGIEYEYEYTLTRDEIKTETLYFYPQNRRRALIFERIGNSYRYGTRSTILRPKDVEMNTSRKNLFLTRASSMNRELFMNLYSFFYSTFLLGLRDPKEAFTDEYLNVNKRLILEFLRICDSDICDIAVRNTILQNPLTLTIDDKVVPSEPLNFKQILTFHRANPDIAFNFDTEESDGTKQLFMLIHRLIDVHYNGKSLILDEFDKSAHLRMAEFVLNYIHASKSSQLLFSSHNVRLIDMKRFRKDQIVFVEKDQNGATSVKPMVAFKEFRENMDAVKAYINGYFGAIPCIETSVASLKRIIKEQQQYDSFA